ncbi:hypothetical protein [Planococcus donghaensis]|uniref:hypothetical protein n=1 Tax=Planococcus donghaensis TaxID=414778 RepID=UPI003736B491
MVNEIVNFDNLNVQAYAVNPVIEVLLSQLLVLVRECPARERDTTETWDIVYLSLKSTVSRHVFEAIPTGQEESNLEKMFVLIIAEEISLEKASPILSNWKMLDKVELDYWINKKFIAS